MHSTDTAGTCLVMPPSRSQSKLRRLGTSELMTSVSQHGTLSGGARALNVMPNTLRAELKRRGIDLQTIQRDHRSYHERPTNTAIRSILAGGKRLHAGTILVELGQFNIHIQRSAVIRCIGHEREHTGTDVFYIAGWMRLKGEPGGEGPMWALGPGVDAVKPSAASKRKGRSTRRPTVKSRAAGRKGPIDPFYYLRSLASTSMTRSRLTAQA